MSATVVDELLDFSAEAKATAGYGLHGLMCGMAKDKRPFDPDILRDLASASIQRFEATIKFDMALLLLGIIERGGNIDNLKEGLKKIGAAMLDADEKLAARQRLLVEALGVKLDDDAPAGTCH